MCIEKAEAAKMYSQAIAGNMTDATVFSNRSATYLALGRLDEALWDAQKCVLLSDGTWSKGFYRLGAAHMSMGKCAMAAESFRRGAELARPTGGCKDLVRDLWYKASAYHSSSRYARMTMLLCCK